jgi:hypothetical protein
MQDLSLKGPSYHRYNRNHVPYLEIERGDVGQCFLSWLSFANLARTVVPITARKALYGMKYIDIYLFFLSEWEFFINYGEN